MTRPRHEVPTGVSCPRHPHGVRDVSRPCKACEKAEALADLRALCPPGTTVYTILRSVSRSGMSRDLSVIVFKDGHALHPNWAVSQVTGHRLNRGGWRDALVSKGCGFNHADTLVQDLAEALHGDSQSLKHQDL